MPQPDVGDVHVNALLTNLSIGYMQDDGVYIADKIFPLIGVDKQSDLYARYKKEAWFRDQGDRMRRAPGTEAAMTGYEIDTTQSYFCLNEAIATQIPDELRSNADDVFELDADATRLVTAQQKIRRERLFATNYMKTGVWTTDRVGTTNFTKWSDYANSDPFTDMENWINTVRQLIGRKPNKLVMGEEVWRKIKHHPDFLDRIKGGATTGNPALFTRGMLANWFEIDEILVGEALYNTANEGQDASLSDVFGDDMLLIYVPNTPGRLTPAAGYTFFWRPMVNGGSIQYIRKIREDRPRRDIIEAHSYFDQKLTAADAGLFVSDAVD